MTDETIRTFITVSGTVAVAWLASGLQGRRERAKEDREARAAFCMERREALVGISSAIFGQMEATIRARNWLRDHASRLDAYTASTERYVALQLLEGTDHAAPPDVLRQVSQDVDDAKLRAVEAADAVNEAYQAITNRVHEALEAAVRYGPYPAAMESRGTLAADVQRLLQDNMTFSTKEADERRNLVLAFAREVGYLAAWENLRATAIKGCQKDPALPRLKVLPKFYDIELPRLLESGTSTDANPSENVPCEGIKP